MDKTDLCIRLNQSFDYLKEKAVFHTISECADKSGIRQPHLSAALKGDGIRLTKGLLTRFADAFPDHINKDWLLNGKGEMQIPDKTLRPHYDTKASAGFMDGVSEGKMSNDFRVAIPSLSEYDFSIDVTGDSMMPKIEDGDILMCRRFTDRLNLPIGKICVFDTKDGIVVKVIKDANEDTITLHSLNSSYHDYAIDANTILGVAEVVGLVRTFK